jgi:selenide,water dikinase
VDREPKYGLAVVGRVHPAQVLRKAGAVPGDVLVLTKPLGTGLITTALKRGTVESASIDAAVASMLRLNQAAGRAAVAHGAHAATDVTGFGLAGHGLEMAERSGVALRLAVADLPLLPGVQDYAGQGGAPGGTQRNRDAYAGHVRGLERLDLAWQEILLDPQTSGGLLVALPPAAVEGFMAAIAANAPDASIIGTVVEGAGLQLLAA